MVKISIIFLISCMEGEKMKKKQIIISTLVLILGIAFYTQIWKPLRVKPIEIRFLVENSRDNTLIKEEDIIRANEEDETTFIIHSFKDKLPSDNLEDYMTINCTLKVSNRSIFNINSFKAAVFELDNYEENVLFSVSSDIVKSRQTWRLSSHEETIRLYVYIGDMDEEAIRELLKGMKAKITYEGDFIGTREEIIKFNDPKNVEIEYTN